MTLIKPVPIRKVEKYISDDGRIVEKISYITSVETDIKGEFDTLIKDKKDFYYGYIEWLRKPHCLRWG